MGFPGVQQTALAAEKTVAFTVPGCNTWGMQARISSILTRIDGIVKFDTSLENTLTVTYDAEKTTPAKIKQALTKGGFAPTVKPASPNWSAAPVSSPFERNNGEGVLPVPNQ